ncbi:MAG: anaerobic sulfite reductase subunit AsrA [Firmicutes bacterium]|nr:anaerobic sulfite reductase subunit AsrA [Bacillota bacterium]
MGYRLTKEACDGVLQKLSLNHTLFAPKRFTGGGPFSGTDLIRYGKIASADEIVLDAKSAHSFKEALLPITETLFYFTEEQMKEPDPPAQGVLVFLRSCDLHAVRRLDEIYLRNGAEDYYYKRIREKTRFALIGCPTAFDTCFCVDMVANRSDNYDFSIEQDENANYLIDCRAADWAALFEAAASQTLAVEPSFVAATPTRVGIPALLDAGVAAAAMWDQYDGRCIKCGRCNFSCPTCTCYTMQDLFYTDNGKAGERRRVWASCMVDGFTDVAGGGCYRPKNGQRMRFKTLHKVFDYKQRFGYQMCVGCGRCDDVCPEYISFARIVNRLEEALREVKSDAAE